MKKLFAVLTLMAAVIMFTSVAMAAEVTLQGTVDSTVVAKTKADKEYVRLIVNESKELNGMKFNKQSVVMAFDPAIVAKAKSLKAGDPIKAVCSSKEYNGRTSYQILALGGMKPVASK
jgi:hypothetical protein